ncbi:restriction endonuclease subunit S [Leuconostoc citreum]|uniref:restriction endonuclease subunit S n=1 Tax=Leuconostoc citreum TaxID=33964 RepID=UPI002958C4EF|nr:restriction endonuclease subunit S [Leuconostoc citreum]MDV8930986.1 restriction endonuclease subunit S [Leuconostoc citreum]
MSKKTPQIRFKGFTDDWEERKLIEVANYRNGKAHEKDISEDGDYIVVNSKFVSTNGLVKKYSDEMIAPLSKNEIAFVLSDVPNGRAIARTFLINKDNKYSLNQRIAGITPHADTNSYFLHSLMNRNHYFLRFDDGVSQTNLSKKEVEKWVELYPIYQEQQKIGSFFKHLDDTIALHQRKLDLLKEQKKGFLQKMFPKNGAKVPGLRFAGFADDWEELNLGDVTTWTKGQGLTKEDLNEERDGSEAVHYADLYKFSPVMHNVIHWTNSDDGRIIPDNSLLFPASDVTPVGLARASTLRLSGVKAGGDVIIGQLDESINSSFMSYQINANSKKILPLITGTTVKHVQAKSLATVSVSITNMAEQTAIAGIFERIDNLIALHQRKLDLLKEQKKGFLQKMFVS